MINSSSPSLPLDVLTSQRSGRQTRVSDPQFSGSECRADWLIVRVVSGGRTYDFPSIVRFWGCGPVVRGVNTIGPYSRSVSNWFSLACSFCYILSGTRTHHDSETSLKLWECRIIFLLFQAPLCPKYRDYFLPDPGLPVGIY